MLADATCPLHPGVAASGTCARCGAFYCARDAVALGAKTYCRACSERPDVDYLETFRQQHLGKRDGWAWLFGVGGVGNLGATGLLVYSFVTALPNGPREALPFLGFALLALLSAVNGIAFWLGQPMARWGVLLVALVVTILEVAAAGALGLAVSAIPLVVSVNLFTNWRTRLFFRLPVQRPTLQAAWDLVHNNTLARQSVIAGVAGLVIPGFGVVALVMGAIGLRRVDPNAYPPIGKKGYAIAGLVLGALGSLAWAAFFVLVRAV